MTIGSKTTLLLVSQAVLLLILCSLLFMTSTSPEIPNDEDNNHEWNVFGNIGVKLEISPYLPPVYTPGSDDYETISGNPGTDGITQIIVNLQSIFHTDVPIIDNIKEASWNTPYAEKYSFIPESQVVEKITYYLLNTDSEFFLLLEFSNFNREIEIIETGVTFDSLNLQSEDSLSLQLTLTEYQKEWNILGNVRLQSYEQYNEYLEKNARLNNSRLSISDLGHAVINEIGYDGTVHASYTYETPGNDTNFPGVIITEVMYDPNGVGDTEEWIELYNPTETTIDLTSWTLTDSAVEFTLSGSIISGDYFVFAKDNAAFQILYPSADLPDLENSTLSLVNNGDTLLLKDDLGTEMDYMAWKNGDTIWKTLSARSTTVRRFSLTDTETVSDWEDSGGLGDPGSGLFAHAYNTTLYSERDEYFVIYNPTASSVSLSNWVFSDNSGKMQFTSGNIVTDTGIIIAKDADSFRQRFNVDADYEWNATWGNDQTNNATVPDVTAISGIVNLTNSGDYLYIDNEITDSDSASVDVIIWETISQDFSAIPEGSFTGTLPSICLEGQAIRRVSIGVDGNEINENEEDLATTFEVVTTNSTNPPLVVSELDPVMLPSVFMIFGIFLLVKKRY